MTGVLAKELRAICLRFRGDSTATVPEPYRPYIPAGWNRVLVLAESQNHGDASYLDWLRKLSPEQRIDRLYLQATRIGVEPWDNRTLQLAVESALGEVARKTAISNAVLWSRIGVNGKGMEPSRENKLLSANLWSKMFVAMGQPLHIVTTGRISQQVISGSLKTFTGSPPKITAWPSPSSRVLNPLSSFICERDLKERFPSVAKALGQQENWPVGPEGRGRILYACLATSVSA